MVEAIHKVPAIATLFLMSGKCKYTYVEVTALINSDGSKK